MEAILTLVPSQRALFD